MPRPCFDLDKRDYISRFQLENAILPWQARANKSLKGLAARSQLDQRIQEQPDSQASEKTTKPN
ncbi:hypothetical protein [Gloeothece verrucosa]|uniref:Uncharacterized protein n=1 Tax=Gloeothece verrucosa (strain PCC 7822) TaxID=497965 RepID=E0U6X5_GLOV7|nr:hypothetical protein [Gloeothece verrucosa]ADN16012.1 hypothetical protein Cyan7822_4092 [Gloeothece verrucosa PCC 7822]